MNAKAFAADRRTSRIANRQYSLFIARPCSFWRCGTESSDRVSASRLTEKPVSVTDGVLTNPQQSIVEPRNIQSEGAATHGDGLLCVGVENL